MINLVPLTDNFIIYQVADYKDIPLEIFESGFYSVTKTEEEISVITNCQVLYEKFRYNKGWKGFRVEGILDFSLIGIINEITAPLKENKISVIVISTFNTDYIFVKEEFFKRAIEVFKSTGSIIIKGSDNFRV